MCLERERDLGHFRPLTCQLVRSLKLELDICFAGLCCSRILTLATAHVESRSARPVGAVGSPDAAARSSRIAAPKGPSSRSTAWTALGDR